MDNVVVKVKETRSEVLVLIYEKMPDELSILREAAKILKREVIVRENYYNSRFHR